MRKLSLAALFCASVAAASGASVTLEASKIEVFTANQTATGTMQPGQQFGWDIRAGKGM